MNIFSFIQHYREQFLKWCGYVSTKHPVLIVSIFLVISIFSGVYSFTDLKMMTDQDQLISEKLVYHKRYMKFLRNFGDMEFIYVVVEVENKQEKAKEFVDKLTEKLKKNTQLESVLSKVDLQFWNLLLLLEENTLKELNNAVLSTKLELSNIKQVGLITGILDYSLSKLKNTKSNFGSIEQLLLLYMLKDLNSALDGKKYLSKVEKLKTIMTKEMQNRSYLFSDDKELLFILILPEKNYETLEVIQKPLDRIRKDLSQVKKDFPDIKVGLTGRPVLQADEMAVTNDDMILASIISILGVNILFIIFLRSFIRPLLTALSLLVGIVITFGITTLAIGHLNILSIVFTIILVGLGIDFGIHLITRYHEELSKKQTVENAIKTTLLTTGKGNLTGGITSAAALFTALLIDFKGLSELGFIAGSGIILTLLSMMLLLPSLLTLLDRKKDQKRLHTTNLVTIPFIHQLINYPRTILSIWGLATLSFCIFLFIGNVTFNNNVLELHAEGIESVKYEKKIIESSESSWFIAFIVNNIQESQNIVNRLKKTSSVGKIESLNDFISNDKILLVKELSNNLDKINITLPKQKLSFKILNKKLTAIEKRIHSIFDTQSNKTLLSFFDKKNEIISLIKKIKTKLGKTKADTVEKLSRLNKNLVGDLNKGILILKNISGFILNQDLKEQLPELIKKRFIERQIPEQIESRLFNTHILSNLKNQENKKFIIGLYTEDKNRMSRFLKKNLDKKQKKRLISLLKKAGYKQKQLVYAYPKGNIWSDKEMKQFIHDVRKVDPKATSALTSFYETSLIINKGLKTTAVYIFILVCLFLYFDFRTLKHTLLALIPLIVGLVWLFGIMAASDLLTEYGVPSLQFNLANFFAIPLIIGTGIDYGVHLVHRFKDMETSNNPRSFLAITGGTASAVALTAFTTMIGFGSLITASHKGLASLGTLMLLGTLTCFLSSIILLPVILKILDRRQKQKLS